MSANGNGNGAPFKLTLRDLPLPVRLVLSLFLIGVGGGYFSALVQLHSRNASPGQPLPTPNDVVEIFSGVEGWPVPKPPPPPLPPGATKTTGKVTDSDNGKITVKPDGGDAREFSVADVKAVTIRGEAGAAADIKVGDTAAVTADKDDNVLAVEVFGPPVSKLESLIMGPEDVELKPGATSMARAFFVKCTPEQHAERQGEQLAVRAWINAKDQDRKDAFENNAFRLPDALANQPITDKYVKDGKVKVQSIVHDRCFKCHDSDLKDGHKKLVDYRDFADVLPAAESEHALGAQPEHSPRQMTLGDLTQSTHLHLLSFCMLWTLTGVIFAFSSHWKWLRCVLAPLVLLAQIADVSCWWLARLTGPYQVFGWTLPLPNPVGPYFALAIIGTGTVVGIGLMLQIVLSLWDMYRWTGRMVLLVLAIIVVSGLALLTPQMLGNVQNETKAAASTAADK